MIRLIIILLAILLFNSCMNDNDFANLVMLDCEKNEDNKTYETNGIIIISAKELHDKYLKRKDYVLIDNRSKVKYNMGHISGAINLNYYKDGASENVLNKSNLSEIRGDKTAIFYCTGHNRACHASLDAIRKWNVPKEKVIWFKGGISEWLHHRYPIKNGND